MLIGGAVRNLEKEFLKERKRIEKDLNAKRKGLIARRDRLASPNASVDEFPEMDSKNCGPMFCGVGGFDGKAKCTIRDYRIAFGIDLSGEPPSASAVTDYQKLTRENPRLCLDTYNKIKRDLSEVSASCQTAVLQCGSVWRLKTIADLEARIARLNSRREEIDEELASLESTREDVSSRAESGADPLAPVSRETTEPGTSPQ